MTPVQVTWAVLVVLLLTMSLHWRSRWLPLVWAVLGLATVVGWIALSTPGMEMVP